MVESMGESVELLGIYTVRERDLEADSMHHDGSSKTEIGNDR